MHVTTPFEYEHTVTPLLQKYLCKLPATLALFASFMHPPPFLPPHTFASVLYIYLYKYMQRVTGLTCPCLYFVGSV